MNYIPTVEDIQECEDQSIIANKIRISKIQGSNTSTSLTPSSKIVSATKTKAQRPPHFSSPANKGLLHQRHKLGPQQENFNSIKSSHSSIQMVQPTKKLQRQSNQMLLSNSNTKNGGKGSKLKQLSSHPSQTKAEF